MPVVVFVRYVQGAKNHGGEISQLWVSGSNRLLNTLPR